MPNRRYVTLKDVAERANTSVATASYVLNGGKGRYVTDELRRSVESAARELNYVRSALASGLKGRQRGVIAVTVPQFSNVFFTRLVLSVEEVALEHGYLVTVNNTFDDPERETKVVESLIQQRVDGVILIPSKQSERNYENLQRMGITTVVAERPVLDAVYDYVLVDNFEAAYSLTNHLLERGHTEIAFFTWDAENVSLRERQSGYRAALQEHGIPYRPEYVREIAFTIENGRRVTEEFLQKRSKCTALIYGYHIFAEGGIPVLQRAGVRIPEDLSVAVIGDPDWLPLCDPALTHVTLPSAEVGTEAARMLFDRILDSDNYPSVRRVLIPGTLVEGNSVKKLN